MSNRELLELAAKAAGIKGKYYEWSPEPGEKNFGIAEKDALVYWNPLDDDGDALRLAVDLIMSVDTGPCRVHVSTIGLSLVNRWVEEDTINQDSLTATRRAIVRAAAEVGRLTT